jgi:hypothetical protein
MALRSFFSVSQYTSDVFSVKKADNSANFAAGGIINRRTRHKSLSRRQEQIIGDQLFDDLQGNVSCDATSHARALPRSYISCQK